MIGDCFPMALHVARELRAEDPDAEVRVVHGLPIGQGAENKGKRYWHAWVEVTMVVELFGQEIEIVSVIDRSNGLKIDMPRVMYFKLGDIDRTWAWTVDEAILELAEREHYGPWVDDWEKYEEVGE